MADLSQHVNYTAQFSGLLNNFYVTVAIAAACLTGHEIGVHFPRRRGRDGHFDRIPLRLVEAAKRGWERWRNRDKQIEVGATSKGSVIDKEGPSETRQSVGSREAWEFG